MTWPRCTVRPGEIDERYFVDAMAAIFEALRVAGGRVTMILRADLMPQASCGAVLHLAAAKNERCHGFASQDRPLGQRAAIAETSANRFSDRHEVLQVRAGANCPSRSMASSSSPK
jgi:hypothetical protein